MSDVLARLCGNCQRPYMVLVPEFLRLPGAATIIGDALDRHQGMLCDRSCRHCRGKIPWDGDTRRRYCSRACADEHRRQRRRMDAEDILHLTSCGVPLGDALAKVGWPYGAAQQWAARHARQDLLAALRVPEHAA